MESGVFLTGTVYLADCSRVHISVKLANSVPLCFRTTTISFVSKSQSEDPMTNFWTKLSLATQAASWKAKASIKLFPLTQILLITSMGLYKRFQF